MEWVDARMQANKLGVTEIPIRPDAWAKAADARSAALAAFEATRDVLGDKLLAWDNANSAIVNVVEQFRAKLEKSDFKLDPKKDAKKIQQVQKLLTGALDDLVKVLRAEDKVIDEVEKHLVQLGKYKQASLRM